MRAHELTESTIELEMVNMLKQKGYKFLGSGVDQSVWLEPGTGLVLKIFGTDKWNRFAKPGVTTVEQKSFIKFANYCMANPNNEFLPQFMGWEKFTFNECTYLQIRCERLFEIDKGKTRVWAEELNEMARYIRLKLPLTTYLRDRNRGRGRRAGAGYYELMTYLGKDGLEKIWKTMVDLYKIANRSGFHLDLHPGNFMLGSDGHIVISDPFFAG